ncbi:MAG: hypothetical protein EOM12_13560 [Verrucomicrobiae bacterium]|nr:hypothetical protein [Verrucomicrobiae bacterium]
MADIGLYVAFLKNHIVRPAMWLIFWSAFVIGMSYCTYLADTQEDSLLLALAASAAIGFFALIVTFQLNMEKGRGRVCFLFGFISLTAVGALLILFGISLMLSTPESLSHYTAEKHAVLMGAFLCLFGPPLIAASRFKEMGRSSLWSLLWFVPIAGTAWFLFCCLFFGRKRINV